MLNNVHDDSTATTDVTTRADGFVSAPVSAKRAKPADKWLIFHGGGSRRERTADGYRNVATISLTTVGRWREVTAGTEAALIGSLLSRYSLYTGK